MPQEWRLDGGGLLQARRTAVNVQSLRPGVMKHSHAAIERRRVLDQAAAI
jgi:hypothetical protein